MTGDSTSVIKKPGEHNQKIRKSISRKRAEILPKSPKTLEDVKIEGAWRKTKQGKEFVLHQEIGLVIFATTEGLEFLVRSKNIMGDGTFKSTPPPPPPHYVMKDG